MEDQPNRKEKFHQNTWNKCWVIMHRPSESRSLRDFDSQVSWRVAGVPQSSLKDPTPKIPESPSWEKTGQTSFLQ